MRIPNRSGNSSSFRVSGLISSSRGDMSFRGDGDGFDRLISGMAYLPCLVRGVNFGSSASDLIAFGYLPATQSANNMSSVEIDVVNDAGVDNTGSRDTTSDILNCYNNASDGYTLRFRPGTYNVTHSVLNLNSKVVRFVGDCRKAIIKCTGATGGSGSYVIRNNVATVFEGITVDADMKADIALDIDTNAHGSTITGCTFKNAISYALYNDRAMIRMWDVIASTSGVCGFRLVAPNGTKCFACSADNNVGAGWHISGANAGDSQSGASEYYGCDSETNNTGGASAQVLLDGVIGLRWYGGYLEGALPILRTINGVHDSHVIEPYVSGNASPTAPYIFEIDYARMCRFELPSSGPDVATSAFRELVGDAASLANLRSYGNSYYGIKQIGSWGTGVIEYAGLLMIDSSATSFQLGTDRNGCFVSSAPPTIGYWLKGDYVRNNAAGAEHGWRCTVGGFPGTWATES